MFSDEGSDGEVGVSVELGDDVGASVLPADGDSAGGRRTAPVMSPARITMMKVPRPSVLRSGPLTESTVRMMTGRLTGIKKSAVRIRIRPPRIPHPPSISPPTPLKNRRIPNP